MLPKLRIAVADDEPDVRDFFRAALPSLGHEVVALAGTGRELIEGCRATRPDLAIIDVRMPDMDGLEAAMAVARERAIPFIVVSGFAEPELVDRAAAGPVLAYLVKPIKQVDLAPAIAVAMRRFAQFREVADQAASLRQALEDRKVVERAKGILMKRAALTEEEAFRRLQQVAAEKNQKLVDTARTVLVAEEAFAAPAGDGRRPRGGTAGSARP